MSRLGLLLLLLHLHLLAVVEVLEEVPVKRRDESEKLVSVSLFGSPGQLGIRQHVLRGDGDGAVRPDTPTFG